MARRRSQARAEAAQEQRSATEIPLSPDDVVTTDQEVLDGTRRVLTVFVGLAEQPSGAAPRADWLFSGHPFGKDSEGKQKVQVPFRELAERDPTLLQLVDLRLNSIAGRASPEGEWQSVSADDPVWDDGRRPPGTRRVTVYVVHYGDGEGGSGAHRVVRTEAEARATVERINANIGGAGTGRWYDYSQVEMDF